MSGRGAENSFLKSRDVSRPRIVKTAGWRSFHVRITHASITPATNCRHHEVLNARPRSHEQRYVEQHEQPAAACRMCEGTSIADRPDRHRKGRHHEERGKHPVPAAARDKVRYATSGCLPQLVLEVGNCRNENARDCLFGEEQPSNAEEHGSEIRPINQG